MLAHLGEMALSLRRAPLPEEMAREGASIAQGLIEQGGYLRGTESHP